MSDAIGLDGDSVAELRARGAGQSILHPEAELERNLVVVDGAVGGEAATDLGDFKPVEVAQRLVRAGERVVDRVLDRVWRGSDDLAD